MSEEIICVYFCVNVLFQYLHHIDINKTENHEALKDSMRRLLLDTNDKFVSDVRK